MDFKFISYALTLPLIALVGCLTNAISVIVYKKIKPKTKFQIYGVICSILHMVYLILLIISDIIKSFSFKNEYFPMLYYFYIEKYLTSCIAITIIFVQMSTFLQHYLLITNKKQFFIRINIRFVILLSTIIYNALRILLIKFNVIKYIY